MLIPRTYVLLAGLLCALLPLLVTPSILREICEDWIEDRWLARSGVEIGVERTLGRVLVIDLDFQALASGTGSWPPPPGMLVPLVRKLSALEAQAVGIDVCYPQLRSDAKGHAELIARILEAGNVVFKSPSGGTGGRQRLSSAEAYGRVLAGQGITTLDAGIGGVVRSIVLDDEAYVVALVRAMKSTPTVTFRPRAVNVKSLTRGAALPILSGGRLRLDHRRLRRIERVPYAAALERLTRDQVAGKVVLIATTAPGFAREYPTPLGPALPEVFLEAMAVESLLSGDVLRPLPANLFLIALLVILAAAMATTALSGLLLGGVVCLLGGGVLVAASAHASQNLDLRIEVLRPILALASGYAACLLLRTYEYVVLGGGRGLGGLDARWAARKLLAEGKRQAQKKKHAAAVDLFQKAIALDSEVKPAGLYNVLVSMLAMGTLDAVEPILEQLDVDKVSTEELYDLMVLFKERLLIEDAKRLASIIYSRDVNFQEIQKHIESIKKLEESKTDIVETTIVRKLVGEIRGLELISRGGMGLVFRGHSIKMDRAVAIKVLAPHLNSNESLVFRFFQEAEALIGFDHPNIVKVFEVVKDGGVRYFVMENIRAAVSLHELLEKERKLPPDRALDVIKQMLDGLTYAHDRGVIHRDIKPGNVMIGEDHRVKLIDFGIARFEQQATVTRTGTILGTPRYMSPEQYRGDRVKVTSDIYSVAVVLFELLTGETGTENPVVDKLKGLPSITQIILRQGLPTPLVGIILRALEMRPERRYQSATEFKEALLEFEKTPHEMM